MNGVLVVLEYRGAWNRLSWEALASGRELASALGQPLFAAVAAGSRANVLPQLARQQLAKAYIIEHELLDPYTADGFTASLDSFLRKLDPAFVLFPHTYQVRDFAPRLATRFEQALIADVVGFHVDGGRPV